MSVRVDNSYIYKYLDEQHARDNARSRGVLADNKKREIPLIATILTGIAIIILCIGLAIYFANSYKKISENSTNIFPDNFKNQYLNKGDSSDEIIDIDSILNNASNKKVDTTEENETDINKNIQSIEQNLDDVESNNVRNYVIFDYIDFDYGGLNQVVIGRQYDDPNSDMSSAWCYVDKYNKHGFKNTFYLVNVSEQKVVHEITDEIAQSFGVTIDILIRAQKLCTI